MAKILVIDDEAAIRRHFKRMLTLLDYEVVLAEDGTVGCELARDPSVSLIISDLTMNSALSDVILIRTLREIRPDVPIVVISGYPTAERMDECMALGVSDFLTKPFELSFIASVLRKLLPQSPAPPAETSPAEPST